jgi:RNA-directed DNA polymerase
VAPLHLHRRSAHPAGDGEDPCLTRRRSQQPLRAVLGRLNPFLPGWVNYFKQAVAKQTFGQLHQFTWWRIVRMMRVRHRWRWKDVRRWLTTPTGRWKPITADEIELFNPATVPITRYRYRGNTIPNPCANAA